MNRRDFLKTGLGGFLSLNLPKELLANPSDIKFLHSNKVQEIYGSQVNNISQKYRMPKNLIYGIIGQENGKPYPFFPTGITEINRWGFMGLGQQNDSSFEASIKQAKIIRDSRKRRDIDFESILLNIEDSKGFLRKSIINPHFEDESLGLISSADLQIESMSSYLSHCQSLFGYSHPDLGIIAYNIGPSKTVEVMENILSNNGISTKDIDDAKSGSFSKLRDNISKIPMINLSPEFLVNRYSQLSIGEPVNYLTEVKRIGNNFI